MNHYNYNIDSDDSYSIDSYEQDQQRRSPSPARERPRGARDGPSFFLQHVARIGIPQDYASLFLDSTVSVVLDEFHRPEEDQVKLAVQTMVEMDDAWNLRKIIASEGGSVAIIQAMKNHPTCKSIQIEGSRLLSRLVNSDETEAVHIVEKGGIEVVLDAIDGFPRSEQVQDIGGCVLRNLALDRATRRKILDDHLWPSVMFMIEAMDFYPNHYGIQENGLIFLEELALESRRARNLILRNNGLSIVSKAYDVHPGLENLARNVIMLLLSRDYA